MFGTVFSPYFLFLKKIRVCLVLFFPLIFCFQKQFSIFKTEKTYLATQNGQKTKTVFKIQFVKETENMQNAVFSF